MKRIEEHLYEHEHTGKDGVTTKRFYAKFTSWDRQALTKPLGDDIGSARVKLQRLHDLNRAKVRVELDEERELREELERQQAAKQAKRAGTTLSEWAETYFAKLVPQNKHCSRRAAAAEDANRAFRRRAAVRDRPRKDIRISSR